MTTDPGPWTIEVYTDAHGSCPYATFLDKLDDAKFAALDAAVRYVLARNGIDLCSTEWLKPIGQSLFEFRVRHDAAEIAARFAHVEPGVAPKHVPILLRVFCHFYGSKVVLLLAGYDKGADPSAKRQQKEIGLARRHLTAWQEARKRAPTRSPRGRPQNDRLP